MTLKSTESELRAFEQKRENKGESVLECITDKLGDVKDKVAGTTKDVANKTKDTIASTSSVGQEQQSSGGDRSYEEGRPGTDAWQMEYIGPDKDKNYVLWVLKNGFFYELSYYNEGAYATYLPEIKAIINSIKFFKPGTEVEDKVQQPKETPSFIANMSMLPDTSAGASNLTVDSSEIGSSQDSSSPQSDLSNIEFSKSTTIQDIINIYNTGVSFDKLMKKVASDAQSPQASIGQASAWDALEYSLSGNVELCTAEEEDDSIMTMLGMDKGGYCNILVSYTYETCKALPTISDCVQDKEEIDRYVANNNLVGKTNDYAYEFLEIMSSRLNQAFSNSIDEMIYFSGDHDRNAVAYIEGRLKVIVG